MTISPGTHQSTRRIILDSLLWSLFVATIKLARVPPKEFSRIDDHLGFNNVTCLPIGPMGRVEKDFSCWMALIKVGILG